MPSRQHDALDYDDAASEAPSAVSGLSVYTDRTHAGATTHAGSSVAPSTVGGRGGKRRHKKVRGWLGGSHPFLSNIWLCNLLCA